jgi:hypothetical protein
MGICLVDDGILRLAPSHNPTSAIQKFERWSLPASRQHINSRSVLPKRAFSLSAPRRPANEADADPRPRVIGARATES